MLACNTFSDPPYIKPNLLFINYKNAFSNIIIFNEIKNIFNAFNTLCTIFYVFFRQFLYIFSKHIISVHIISMIQKRKGIEHSN